MRLPRFSFKRLAFVFLGLYFIATCYTGFILFRKHIEKKGAGTEHNGKSKGNLNDDLDWNPWGMELEGGALQHDKAPVFETPKVEWKTDKEEEDTDPNPRPGDDVVEVWGKAAIGLYLWEHIMQGKLEEKLGGTWSYGMKRIKNTVFKFRTGPGVVPVKVPHDIENLVLILNGREPSKVEYSRMWLDYLPHIASLQNVGIVILGDERCENQWLHPYLWKNGGLVKFVFLVYDSPEIDEHTYFQWPLGVATYRKFPHVKKSDISSDNERDYICNFMGTLYKNSSRDTLMKVLQKRSLQDLCYLQTRTEWLPQETDDSRADYIGALAQSDLTLNPVGKNSECYRIYEAMSFGSIPVVENVMTPGKCGNSSGMSLRPPLRLLKQYGAPMIYVSHWSQLSDILEEEQEQTVDEVVKRRQQMLAWYEQFKSKMREKFVKVVRSKFFSKQPRR